MSNAFIDNINNQVREKAGGGDVKKWFNLIPAFPVGFFGYCFVFCSVVIRNLFGIWPPGHAS